MSDIAVKTSDHVVARERLTEDWLSVAIGVLVFALALFSLSGTDLLGWAITTSVYTNLTQALAPFAKGYAWLGGGGALVGTHGEAVVGRSLGVCAPFGGLREVVLSL